jgi:hypothetical protein
VFSSRDISDIGIDILSFMKQQFAVTHTICQTEIPALQDSWFTNTLSVKMLRPHTHTHTHTHTHKKNLIIS